MRKSIFELERRSSLKEEYENLREYLINSYLIDEGYEEDVLKAIAETFTKWPLRGTALNPASYFSQRNLNLYHINNDTEALYFFEFIFNFLYSAINDDYFNVSSVHHAAEHNKEVVKVIFENTRRTLESINMKIKHIEKRFIFTKRDADVDSIIEQVPVIKDLLLSYLDFRNEKDIHTKKTILKHLGDYIEKNKDSFKQYDSNLFNDIGALLNKGSIRHNNDKQINFQTEQEQIECYDKTFKLIIHLIRHRETLDIQNNYVKPIFKE